ncbi:MAG: co-chaperone GroES [Chlamydiae bacterium]|jgi:chaperonin GroES|nr:co-chaperone GroES [Chlamydiota bacterium]
MAIETINKISLKPIGNRVVVKRMEQQETSKGGILLPDSAKKKQETAKVVAVGPGRPNKDGHMIEVGVKVGDIVLMDKYSGQEVTINDEEFLILKSDDIIAIVEA